jgi:hypothetical protein
MPSQKPSKNMSASLQWTQAESGMDASPSNHDRVPQRSRITGLWSTAFLSFVSNIPNVWTPGYWNFRPENFDQRALFIGRSSKECSSVKCTFQGKLPCHVGSLALPSLPLATSTFRKFREFCCSSRVSFLSLNSQRISTSAGVPRLD